MISPKAIKQTIKQQPEKCEKCTHTSSTRKERNKQRNKERNKAEKRQRKEETTQEQHTQTDNPQTHTLTVYSH